MPLNVTKARELLKSFEFRRLFIEETGLGPPRDQAYRTGRWTYIRLGRLRPETRHGGLHLCALHRNRDVA